MTRRQIELRRLAQLGYPGAAEQLEEMNRRELEKARAAFRLRWAKFLAQEVTK